MSYSRWMFSDFYTYWASSEGSGREDQIFMLHMDLVNTYEVSYEEVKVYLGDRGALQDRFDLTDRETDELLGYMEQFVADVDEKFGEGDCGEA